MTDHLSLLIPQIRQSYCKISLQRIVAKNLYAGGSRNGMDLQTTPAAIDDILSSFALSGTPTGLFTDQKSPTTAN